MALVPPPAQLQYRRELDGLRAVALCAVLLGHAHVPGLRGGFVGVDVFFVLSGYLITALISQDLQAGAFSLMAFYERRARRILPALMLVMAACLTLGALWLLPVDFRLLAQSVVAVSVFASNVLFWTSSGYFDSSSELKPLLHTWSLGVEEQFYVLFPLLLRVLPERARIPCLLALTASSLMCSVLLTSAHPQAAFYLLPTRAWQLALGALVALSPWSATSPSMAPPRRFLQAGAFLGLAGIVLAVVLFDEQTAFPGHAALLPSIGAALVITCALPSTWVGALLGHSLPVGIGLISYSAYLWHQPLLAFARYRTPMGLSTYTSAALAGLSLGLGYLSWRLLERPFRNRSRITRRGLVLSLGLGSCVLLAVGSAGHFMRGFPNRPAPAHLPHDYLRYAAIERKATSGQDGALCISEQASYCHFATPQPPTGPRWLLAGDSHSADLTTEFRSFVAASQRDGWQMSIGGCGFLLSQDPGHRGECKRARELLPKLARSERFDQIVLVGNYLETAMQQSAAERGADLAAFVELVEALRLTGAKVAVFAPRYALNVDPMLAAVANQRADVHVADLQGASSDWSTQLGALAQRPNVRVFDQAQLLLDRGCGRADCFDGHDRQGYPLYRDRGHLTEYGAKVVWEGFSASLR